MSWWSELGRRLRGEPEPVPVPELPPAPTSEEILASVEDVRRRVAGRVPPAVQARVERIARTVAEMVPRLDRPGLGSRQAHTVVATATSYLPEAVDAYLRLPRDFADRRVVADGKTSLMLLVDQLDLLGATIAKISDAVSRQDANALIAHGAFLEEKFRASTLDNPPEAS
ncbi:MAG TPA: hypothetical protein VKY71_09560 [Actinotalea caeni]|uniref:hypothetical protein n=1 Tax=Actinotalea caeni TaxID=1348467 RepID=UPI002B4AAF79|nr:hypothetical protein [Actinotalea caeni]HLV55802.1 hypothetical protein [Actinotalea caeni]